MGPIRGKNLRVTPFHDADGLGIWDLPLLVIVRILLPTVECEFSLIPCPSLEFLVLVECPKVVRIEVEVGGLAVLQTHLQPLPVADMISQGDVPADAQGSPAEADADVLGGDTCMTSTKFSDF